MRRTLLYSIMGLMLVLGLILPMAVPAIASEITVIKDLDPDESPYYEGETIHFVMTVINPEGNLATNTLDNIWDTLPNGSIHYFIERGVDSPLVQLPGDNATFYLDYEVDCDDIYWNERVGNWTVTNEFEVEGFDSLSDDVYGVTTRSPVVIPCELVGGEAFAVGRLSVLAPWIALGAAIVAGAAILVRRRRHARS